MQLPGVNQAVSQEPSAVNQTGEKAVAAIVQRELQQYEKLCYNSYYINKIHSIEYISPIQVNVRLSELSFQCQVEATVEILQIPLLTPIHLKIQSFMKQQVFHKIICGSDNIIADFEIDNLSKQTQDNLKNNNQHVLLLVQGQRNVSNSDKIQLFGTYIDLSTFNLTYQLMECASDVSDLRERVTAADQAIQNLSKVHIDEFCAPFQLEKPQQTRITNRNVSLSYLDHVFSTFDIDFTQDVQNAGIQMNYDQFLLNIAVFKETFIDIIVRRIQLENLVI